MANKMTLLEMVQSVLNDMDGDQVNSINDTIESEQVATIIRDTFFAIISNRNWPHLKKLVALQSSGTASRPTHIVVPDNIKEMISINYNKIKSGETRKRYEPVRYMSPDDFLVYTNRRNNDASNVDVIQDTTGIELLIMNDRAPCYYTSFDDEHIVMDSYDIGVDSTLQQSKIQAFAVVSPEWVHEDDAIPDLPEEAFVALLEEAKSRAALKLKQTQDLKAEQESVRQQNWLSRKAWKVAGGIRFPDYGRRGGKSYRDPTFRQD